MNINLSWFVLKLTSVSLSAKDECDDLDLIIDVVNEHLPKLRPRKKETETAEEAPASNKEAGKAKKLGESTTS